MNLIELQNKIHEQNKAMGWWDEPRPFSTFVCLFHSELSEAMEGDRKGLMDDHLPQYEMFWVELADFVIRCLDYLGGNNYEHQFTVSVASVNDSKMECLAFLHSCVTSAHQTVEAKNNISCLHILSAITAAFTFSKATGVDLEKIILEKVEYNKHRADHQRENRAKEGGKKY